MNSEQSEGGMAKGRAGTTRAKQSGGSVANVTHSLKGIVFPARKADLLDRAKKTMPSARSSTCLVKCRIRIIEPWLML
jgi:hypothetical protein